MLTKESQPYGCSSPCIDLLLVVSVRGNSQTRFVTDLIKCTKKNKLSENVAGLSLVDMWPIFHHLLSLCNLKHRRRSLPHNAQKCNSAAPRRAGVDLYLDKQIDKQSTLFHYRAEKLTTNANSGSTASVETSKGEEEQNKMNSQFISEQTLTMASYWLRTSWVETILSVF